MLQGVAVCFRVCYSDECGSVVEGGGREINGMILESQPQKEIVCCRVLPGVAGCCIAFLVCCSVMEEGGRGINGMILESQSHKEFSLREEFSLRKEFSHHHGCLDDEVTIRFQQPGIHVEAS